MSQIHHRHLTAAAAAALALGGIGPTVGPELLTQSGLSPVVNVVPPAPAIPSQGGTAASVLKRLGFMRAYTPRPHYTGKGWSVAHGKRMARKKRNRQAHKKQWKAHVR